MDELRALRSLAKSMGVQARYTDGLGKRVVVAPETLLRICAALGAPVENPSDAPEALAARRAVTKGSRLPPVLVAWDGMLPAQARGYLDDGTVVYPGEQVPLGYHRLSRETRGRIDSCALIAAPVEAWRRAGSPRSWGIGTHLAALRSSRSRSLGDLRDLALLCRWIRERGGDLVTVLPLLPTFNTEPAEPSPYSPVSRLFWSELMLDLGKAHLPSPPPKTLDVRVADAEVRLGLAQHHAPDPALMDDELIRYARFRGAQARLGRNWRDWPAGARAGALELEQIDRGEERLHLVAQTLLRTQLQALRLHLQQEGMRLGLDLAVGVHPDGYDPWSRQGLFAEGMSVGAPPDQGFPSGQDWGFSPVLPDASRLEGHRYLAASIGHQAGLAGVLRIDHIMAWTRLYWIPHGMRLDQGTYVSYPAEELFGVLTLESHLNRCEVVGENLGNVPPEIDAGLPRHRIWGMSLAEFQASGGPEVAPPTEADVALIGTHDTPTFAGWLVGNDIGERVRYGLLAEAAVPEVRKERSRATRWLAQEVGSSVDNSRAFLAALLTWLGRSDSPLVIPWLEDFWLEDRAVNLPGTPSSIRPNWQRPMRRLLDDILADPKVNELLGVLQRARSTGTRNAER